MFRKQDFKKVDLLGSGKKNTKIYKAEHIPSGKYYAIKEVEAKTIDKLNEYKVSKTPTHLPCSLPAFRKKLCNYSKFKATQT
jgi:serine/threonine protein kinase